MYFILKSKLEYSIQRLPALSNLETSNYLLRLASFSSFNYLDAASFMSVPVWMSRPESERISLPASTLVPSSLTTKGTFIPTSPARFHDTIGDGVALHNAAENINEYGLYVFIT